MNYRTAVLKRNIELAGMFPFVILGKLAGKIFRLKTRHNVFLFYPSGDIGGSPKVNIDIANCIKDSKPLIIFSKKPNNNKFRHLYDIDGVRVIDLHKYIDNKLFHIANFFFRGVIASWVNQAKHPVVFGGESMYFYKVIPHIGKGARIVELCHLNTWFNFSQAFISFIDLRIFSTPGVKRDVERQYAQNNVPKEYLKKLRFIDNPVDIPQLKTVENEKLEIVFVGRGAPQKRVHLIAEVARKMHEAGKNVHFSFVGDVEDIVPVDVKQYCTLYGNINDKAKLEEVYDKSDVLLLTSTNEGLPIVVMDMMARAKAIVSTAVGGIPDYIVHNKSGMLIYETEEQAVVAQAISYIDVLNADPIFRKEIGMNAYKYAIDNFSNSQFCATYRSILLGI